MAGFWLSCAYVRCFFASSFAFSSNFIKFYEDSFVLSKLSRTNTPTLASGKISQNELSTIKVLIPISSFSTFYFYKLNFYLYYTGNIGLSPHTLWNIFKIQKETVLNT